MNPKLKIVAISILVFVAGALILVVLGRNPVPMIGIGAIITFMLFVLWEMPEKHKDFTWGDRQKALFHSLGGNPPPEVPNPNEIKDDQENQDKTG